MANQETLTEQETLYLSLFFICNREGYVDLLRKFINTFIPLDWFNIGYRICILISKGVKRVVIKGFIDFVSTEHNHKILQLLVKMTHINGVKFTFQLSDRYNKTAHLPTHETLMQQLFHLSWIGRQIQQQLQNQQIEQFFLEQRLRGLVDVNNPVPLILNELIQYSIYVENYINCTLKVLQEDLKRLLNLVIVKKLKIDKKYFEYILFIIGYTINHSKYLSNLRNELYMHQLTLNSLTFATVYHNSEMI